VGGKRLLRSEPLPSVSRLEIAGEALDVWSQRGLHFTIYPCKRGRRAGVLVRLKSLEEGTSRDYFIEVTPAEIRYDPLLR
jgi:hypothetical protein